jgi:hypothetical protein
MAVRDHEHNNASGSSTDLFVSPVQASEHELPGESFIRTKWIGASAPPHKVDSSPRDEVPGNDVCNYCATREARKSRTHEVGTARRRASSMQSINS